MATLFNTRISDTYVGLIKTTDNAAISATLRQLSDGSGNLTGLYLNNAGDFKVTSILEFGSLKDTAENITISKFVDAADGIANNDNDTSIPTSAAVVSYVAAQITAEDLDFRGDDSTVLGDVDLNSEAFIILGTANEIETTVSSAGGNQLQIGLPNNVTITSDLSAVNLNASNILTTLEMRLKGSINVLNKAGNNYQAFAQRDVTGSTAVINLNNIGAIGASGTITAPTFSGQLSGTISSATTATTQTAGDNSTKVATTAYVDSLDAGSDLDFSGTTGTGAVVLNTEAFAITGTTNEIETTASGTGLSIKFPTAGVVLPDGSTATTQATSDDSTKVATTAYVKSLDNASDLDFSGDTGTGDVTLNTQTFSVIGTSNQVETTASNQQLQIGLPSSISVNSASATALQTARDISLTGQATATISGFDGSSDVSGAVTLDNNSVTAKVLTGLAAPTATNITASDSILQAFGKAQSQINTLAGGLRFMGTWDATNNTPTLASGGGESASGTTTSTTANKLVDSNASFTSAVDGDKVVNQASGATATVNNVDSSTVLTLSADIMVSGQEYTIDNSPFITQGHYFVVSVGGTSSLNGLSNWAVGDWVIAGAGNVWEKLDHTQVDGTGTAGNIAKFSSTNVIADSIMAETGAGASALITVDGSLSVNQNITLVNGNSLRWTSDDVRIEATTSTDNMKFYVGGSEIFKLEQTETLASFAGKVSVGGGDTSTAQMALKGQQSLLSFIRGTAGDAQFFMSSDSQNLYFSHTDIQSTNLILKLNQDESATFASDVTIGSTGAGSDKILNILTGGSDSTIKLMEAGTVYGFSQVYSGANNQFYIKRHSNSATGSAVITLNRDDDNATFAGDVTVGALTSGQTAKLVVNDEGGATSIAKFMARTNRAIVQISDNDTTGYLNAENGVFSIGRAAGADANNINIDSSNNVGIGVTDPDYTLHLLKSSGDTEVYVNGQNGQSSIRMGLDARNWQIKTAAAPYLWSLNYVGTDVPLPNIITAKVSGQVGFGTDAPTGKVEIQQPQRTTQFDRDSFLRLHPSAHTNSGGFTNMFFGTSTTNNYGVAIGGLRAGTTDSPSFSIRMLDDSITGTEALRINTAGDTSLQNTLTVNKTAANAEGGSLVLRNAGGGSGALNRIYFAPTASAYATRSAIIEGKNLDGNNNMALLFKTSAGNDPVQHMIIDQNGDVGIGTVSATSGSRVTIQESGADGSSVRPLVLRNYSAGTFAGYVSQEFQVGTLNVGEIGAQRVDANNGRLYFRNKQAGSITDAMVIDQSGVVTIGAAKRYVDSGSTQFNFEINEGMAFGGNAFTFATIQGDGAGLGNIEIRANAYPANTGTESSIKMFTSTSSGGQYTPMTIRGPFVGINEDTPDTYIHVKNTSGDNRGIKIENTVTTSYAELQLLAASEFRLGTGGSGVGPNGAFYIYDATAGKHRFDIDGDGNVGIGGGAGRLDANSRLDVRRAGNGIALELHQTSGNADDFVDLKMIAGNTTAGTLGTILRHQRQGSGGGSFRILTNPTLSGTPRERVAVMEDGLVQINSDSANTNQAVHKQILTVHKGLSAAGTVLPIAFVDHSHALDVKVTIKQDTANVATGIGHSVCAYGTANTGMTTVSGSGNVTGITLAYLNTNPSGQDYVLTLTWTGSGASPEAYVSITGTSTGRLAEY